MPARIEDGLQTPRRQLLNLAGRQVDAVALRDARLDFPDDLVDVDAVGPGRIGRCLGLRPAVAAPVGPAAPAVEVGPAAAVGVLVSSHR